ncbi:hypothetical protein Tco_1038688 [Tanacetum coccineum]
MAPFLLRCGSFADLLKLALLLLLECLCRSAMSGPSRECTLLLLSPNHVKTFLSLGPSLVNIVAFTRLLQRVGFSPSYLSLEKALAFCEGCVPLDALIGLGLLFLGLLFLSHDSDFENWVCEFRCELSPKTPLALPRERIPRLDSGVRVSIGYEWSRGELHPIIQWIMLSVFGTLTFFLDFLCPVSYSFDPVTGGHLSWSERLFIA